MTRSGEQIEKEPQGITITLSEFRLEVLDSIKELRDSLEDFKKDTRDTFVHKNEYSDDKKELNRKIDAINGSINKVVWAVIGTVGIALINWILRGGLSNVPLPN